MVEPEQDADHAMMISEYSDFEWRRSGSHPHTTRDRVEARSAEMRYGLKFFATVQSSLGSHQVKRREWDSDLEEKEGRCLGETSRWSSSSRLLCRSDCDSQNAALEPFAERIESRASRETAQAESLRYKLQSRCSTSLLRCRPILHETWLKGLRGGDGWKMAPARQSHEV